MTEPEGNPRTEFLLPPFPSGRWTPALARRLGWGWGWGGPAGHRPPATDHRPPTTAPAAKAAPSPQGPRRQAGEALPRAAASSGAALLPHGAERRRREAAPRCPQPTPRGPGGRSGPAAPAPSLRGLAGCFRPVSADVAGAGRCLAAAAAMLGVGEPAKGEGTCLSGAAVSPQPAASGRRVGRGQRGGAAPPPRAGGRWAGAAGPAGPFLPSFSPSLPSLPWPGGRCRVRESRSERPGAQGLASPVARHRALVCGAAGGGPAAGLRRCLGEH